MDESASIWLRIGRTLLAIVSLAAIGAGVFFAWQMMDTRPMPFFDPCTERPDATVCARKQCAIRDFQACADLGYTYEVGHPVKPNPRFAAFLYERGCDGDNQKACAGLGVMLAEGMGVPKNAERGKKLLAGACEARDQARACATLGGYEIKGNAEEAKEGAAKLEKACDAGYAEACVLLANWLQQQSGVEEARIDALLTTACDGNHGAACLQQAMRELGEVSGFDAERVTAMLNKACTRNQAEACGKLQYFDEYNEGVPAPAPALLDALDQRCREQKNAAACEEASRLLTAADGVKPNPGRVMALQLVLCNEGKEGACTAAGKAMFAAADSGDSLAKQRLLFDAACQGGDESACTVQAAIDQVIEQLGDSNDAQLREALSAACEAGVALACSER